MQMCGGRWARPRSVAATGQAGEAEVTAALPLLFPKGSAGMRPVLPEGCGAEEKSPHCSDHRDPPTLLIQSRDGAKPPEPQEDPPPTQNTLTLEIQGWMSPMGAMDWVFLPLGAPRLLLERVWSDQAVQSCPSRMRQRWWIQARDVGLAFPRMLSTLSPLLDRVTGVGPRGPRNAGDKAEAGTGTWAGPVGHSSRAQARKSNSSAEPKAGEGVEGDPALEQGDAQRRL
ncbi:uncharacterized protein LOC126642890 isoform X3 [Myiozetetes cayanensis]|uniref:uncharacterized protein LOC126642890 isoform X3 n=1 Tax=Myiozetetes cayanensis TaxID=478635 RepID=UPI002161013E|nr:uncharacterized protein LOC126642890 isoform X3 [Myiozetetes cayanensis]